MKARFSALLACLALSLSLPVHAQGHDHANHGSTEPQRLQLDAGKKWATDQHLRQAMNDINQAMSAALPRIHKNQFSDGDYQALAGTVSQKVAYAVEHCKLTPKADAMLHLVIADLMDGAEIMEGKRPGSRHDGAAQVLQALQVYGKYFQHPGWKVAKG
jgi:hypothetical protein